MFIAVKASGYRQAMTIPQFSYALPLLAVLGSVTALGIGTSFAKQLFPQVGSLRTIPLGGGGRVGLVAAACRLSPVACRLSPVAISVVGAFKEVMDVRAADILVGPVQLHE